MSVRTPVSIKIDLPNSIFSGERTYSSLFLPPAFDLNFDSEIYDYFVNAYIDDDEKSHSYKRPLFVLMETSHSLQKFSEVDRILRDNRNFVYTYFVGADADKFYYMYVFECPDEFRYDYDCFLRGEYSKFSTKYKSRFSKMIPSGNSWVESPLFGVIYKTSTHKKKVEHLLGERLDKEQEFFGQPDRKIEVFRYKIK